MREMKDSGIEWIGTIPDNWDIMPNKYLMWKKKRICPVYNEEDIISLSMNGVIVRDLDAGGKMPTSFDGYQYIESGNLLMCLFDIDVTPRCIGLIKCNGLTSPAYSQFVLTNRANAGYYNYYYTMLDNDKTLVHLAKNLRHSLTEEQLGTISTIVPPIDEQIKISDYLDKKCEEINSVVAQLQEEIEALEEYKRSVITEAVTKGLDPDVEMRESGIAWVGDIPAHWITHPLYFYFGERKNKNALGLETNLFSLSYGKIIRKDINSNGGLLPESFNTYNIIEKDDIIIRPTDLQNDKRSLRTGIAREHGIITSAYIAMKAIKSVNPEYFHYLLHAYDVMKVFYNMGNGVRQGLNFSEFSRLMVFEPTIEEQNAIVAYLNEKCDEIDLAIADKKQQIETIEEYKKSLIFEYVTGKKEVPSQAVIIDPRVILAGTVLSKLGANLKGKIQVQKIMYLCETILGLPLKTQYFRYPHGPYDKSIDTYLAELNSKQWFIIQDNSPMTCCKGAKFSDFENEHLTVFSEYNVEIEKIVSFIAPMKTSQAERIATLFAVWNDFIIDGVMNPSDEQIINEVVTKWTPNKANSEIKTWKGTLDKMKKNGIIPKGFGMHTQPKDI